MMCEKSKNTHKQREIFTESYREKKISPFILKGKPQTKTFFLFILTLTWVKCALFVISF